MSKMMPNNNYDPRPQVTANPSKGTIPPVGKLPSTGKKGGVSRPSVGR